MIESFAKLFKKSLKKTKTNTGSIICGKVISILKNIVLVDGGLKSESAIPIEQFLNNKGKLEIKIGDKVDVALDAIEDGFGETQLSREKAKKNESWIILKKIYEENSTIIGIVNGKVKGGFTVELNDIKAFLPGSLVDIRPIKENLNLEGKKIKFKIIKLDQKRNNVVVSRKAVIESESDIERNNLLKNLKEGINIKGTVKNLTDYGAFIDLGGVDGLLHITDMAWKRVKHPSEILNIGEEITVNILKFDKEKTRVSLGLKQLETDPWIDISKRYPINKKLTGRVTNITDYGCFVEIESGIEGLVHISEMDWTNKNINPSKLVKINDIVEFMVLDIDEDRRRISLGIKQCKINPWKKFNEVNNKGDCVKGKIKSITDFGIFLGLEDGIDGLVHLSDISWTIETDKIIKKYKLGDEIIAVILQIDAERERISLGIKQLYEDPFNNYIYIHKKGDIVNGKITEINKNCIFIKLENGILGYIRNIENKNKFNIGDNIKAKFTAVDRKKRIIILSYLK